ncbi:TRAM domain-containing protein [Halorubrum lacusprofundi]|jgi:predicted RNA-binding protein with TRAM domain|uniref:Deoxyribonuclease/rho motif-related TRAM n=1 Tax=Halorubrum lacusprofundi (strain ATCC 49239 / DSM 5036 / JCM 8891 / ACAM 34) TaxID=416348 RepID=B9LWI9_HALLT|nr:TRAM domain-containing protein [Halorubrum lacusprofundi]ACM58830.1 deoxyribonuclease/rho motif-related TRAM [Halorubrum lacusprofundi ATCC 49239]MCG1008306.1 TRAM domain-containing protein [Halorubrum lacusprofundi]
MEISEQLNCLFSAAVKETADTYVIEVPHEEVTEGFVDKEEIHQVALLSTGRSSVGRESSGSSQEDGEIQDPPVSEGDKRIVEISETGDQGDGLTRVERGFVVIVPGAQVGDRVRIYIETVRDTVAFGEVVERLDYEN